MKIHLMSDLHLEFGRGFDIPETDADIIVLAGDIQVGTKAIPWIKEQTEKPVIYVAGNHEYYKHRYPDLQDDIREACKDSNIHFLENDSVVIDGVLFIGCTLWTDYNLFNQRKVSMYEAKACMNDFRVIKAHLNESWRKLKPSDCLESYQNSIRWLSKELENNEHTRVVVTHHAPSNISNSSVYRFNDLAPAFASRLEGFIEKYKPVLWIHGHMHNNSDYMIGETRVLCNPRGYQGIKINHQFDQSLTVEI
jgi:Icc-related predicted phosphoesterase